MRIIAFGDIHMATTVAANIPSINEADLVIATGDLTNYGKKAEARQVLDDLLSCNRNLLAMVGNLDNFEINDYLDELGINLHRQARLLDRKICLVGAGGSNKTPFGTPTEFSEDELSTILSDSRAQGKEFISLAGLKETDVPMLLISHTPPHGTAVDRLSNGGHAGSVAVRQFIEEHQPQICITGHIHEARGEDHIGNTHIINPGMLQNGGWVEIVLNHSTPQSTIKATLY